MAEGERVTGTPNTVYDLSSVLFHALEGGASYDQYIRDAEEEGDRELAEFFRLVRVQDSDRVHAAHVLLGERSPTARRMDEAPRQDERERARQEEREREEGGILGRARDDARREEGRQEEGGGLLDRVRGALGGQEEHRRDR